jgi:sodium/bile acid cotransporter 7
VEAKKPRVDPFLVGMLLAVVAAWIYPAAGASGGWMHPAIVNKAGVSLIFFLHGAGLSFAALKAGTLRWPLHLLVQATTFVLFPLIGLVLLQVGGGVMSRDLSIGVFFLCALPSTVSSSVALTALARGNVAAAVFNATASNLLGVVATPLWLSLVLKSSGHELPLGKIILDLLLWLVLPLAVGQVLRPLVAGWLKAHRSIVQVIDRGTILLLVHTSFADSFHRQVWSSNGLAAVATALIISALLLGVVMALGNAATKALGFPVEDRITAVFCGSKKSLASGVPMAQVIFRGHPGLGVVLLPLLIYHPLQLVVCGWFAARWARRTPPQA